MLSAAQSPTPVLSAPAQAPDHIRPLLWKNFLLKKKHPVKWALEMIVPVAFIILLGGLKHLMDDVKVPSGWADETNPPGDDTLGTGYNLYATSRLMNATYSKYYTTESTMAALLMNLAVQAFQNAQSMADFTLAQNLSCSAFVVQGKVSLDPTSPNAVPKECMGRIVPWKIAVVPDTAFTRNYFAKTIAAWHPAVPLTNTSSILGRPTIPAFGDSIIFFPDEAKLEAHVMDNLYGTDLDHPRIHSAIVFNAPPAEAQIGSAVSLDYSIRLNSTLGRGGIPGDVPRTNLPAYDPLQKSISVTNYQNYALTGFMTLQTLVTRFALCQPTYENGAPGNCTNVKTTAVASPALDARLFSQVQNDFTLQTIAGFFNKLSPTKINFDQIPEASKQALLTPLRQAPQPYFGQHVYPFPIQGYTSSPFYTSVSSFFAIIFIISYLFSISSILVALITEKENKSRELMKILGVHDRAIIWSWYITYGAIFVVAAILQAVASKANLFSNCNVVLVFIFFLLFGWSVLAFGFMVSSVFSKSRIGTYVGIILFFVMYLITSGFSATTAESTKNAMCIFAPVAMAFGVQTMANAEASSLGITFGNVNEPYQNFRFSTSLYYMAFDIVLYTLLGLYLEKVVPKDYGITEKWYFLVSPSYWRNKRSAGSVQTNLNIDDAAYVEGAAHDAIEPVGMELKAQEATGEALQIRRLRREFKVPGGTKVAVHGLDLTMYKNQITCLLGHNGAGKTTLISMLTGMIPASGGDATFNGLSLRNDLSELRQSLGMCPQHDVLYAELTVEEHLIFYGRIKGFSGKALTEEVADKIAEVGLTEKRHVASSELSGGMKRKLSLAIALLGDSKIVFLDEPTSGMDPYSRRSSWEIIMNNRMNRIVVLTTHFMDEADILGDRIAIMAEGQLRCVGSSLFLKNRYGAGYNFALVRTETCDTAALIAFVQSHIPVAKVLSNVGTEMSFQLPLDHAPSFAAMFADLEVQSSALGVLSYGISVTTLEEVFIKVAEIGDEHQQHTLQPRNDAGPLLSPAGYKINTAEAPPSRLRMFGRHFVALFKKRFRTAKRDKKIVLFGAVLPVVFLILGMCILKFSSLSKNDTAMSINLQSYGSMTSVPVTCQGDAAWCAAFPAAYAAGKASLLSVPTPAYPTNNPTVFDITYTNPAIAANDTTGTCLATGYEVYQRGYGGAGASPVLGQYGGYVLQASSVDNTYGYNVLVNTTAVHAAPNYKAAIDETLYQLFTQQPGITLKVTSHPLPLTAMTKTLFTTFMSFATSIFVVLAFAFFTASIVPYLVNEKHHSHNSKHQQLVSGVSLPAFWLANFAWDMMLFMIPCVIGLVAIYLFDITPFTGNDCFGCAANPFGAVITLFVLLGFALCSFCYCLSYLFSEPASSQTYTIMTNIALGTVLMTVSIVLDVIESTKDINPSLKFIWRLSPLFCVGNALNQLSIYTIRSTFGRTTKEVSSFSTDVIGYEIMYLAIEAVLFPILAIGIDYALSFPKIKAKLSKDPVIVDAPVDIDVDVQAEADRVNSGRADNDAVVMRNLRKVYKGGKVGVSNIALALPKGECFGYLGINGAGKTSTMKMMTGDVLPTSGTATLGGFDILSQQIEVRRLMGYCPQFDALMDLLTVREHLELFAAIKGVPSGRINDTVAEKMTQMNLNDFEHKLAGTLSGGNKRKLSVAIAMIGAPPIIFLDEPSTGMDPVSRRFMWDVIADISTRSKESTILLTTHSMEECEALCTRVGIMVGGRLRCLGSIQHLKHRFGDGLMMHIKLAHVPGDAIMDFVEHEFGATPTLSLEDAQEACRRLGKPQRSSCIAMDHATGYTLMESITKNQYIRARDFCTWWLTEDRFEAFNAFLATAMGAGHAQLLERQNDVARFKLMSPTKLLLSPFFDARGLQGRVPRRRVHGGADDIGADL
ncbi:hypothetical protein SPRG_00314 [Saprolegnia parasitica CBS 223.65]|uniref:ABC transporter domain-containing protein n=1 Tax=Saprolegnia parasitica (strain CBS 223.65) TaxID=695850 RepID=A0A067D8Y0_SAPPC|nr:hypothetical protein SPRG_00314 [Saprolegnia parasitica CBS 223.65]KDO35467.1 hypothetical protein SPRG_00314 [Saprolegnia parasitica CBS 223.65]|eukprot:XP_012193804.1 hypothetical protein SPRG_00314 [Saprolegnia parasitica CBS 223.65]